MFNALFAMNWAYRRVETFWPSFILKIMHRNIIASQTSQNQNLPLLFEFQMNWSPLPIPVSTIGRLARGENSQVWPSGK
jgi:hypothetical protein